MRKALILIILVGLVSFMAGCGQISKSSSSSSDPIIYISGIASTIGSDQYVKVNSTKQLSVVVEPAGINTIVNWSSSDDSMATVDGSGLVSAGSMVGSVTVSATTQDGIFSKDFNMVITTNDVVEELIAIASDAASSDEFGYSVDIDGDTAVVGAFNNDDNGNESGSIYIFVRQGTSWSQQAKLIASDGSAGDLFGYSVAISGDTVVVGALYNDKNGSNAGLAYVYTRSGSLWTEQAKIEPLNPDSGQHFGYSVDIDDDTIVVGSEDGIAFVFTQVGSTWTQQDILAVFDASSSECFGKKVAIDGDQIAVSAYYDDDKGYHSGSVYVFSRSGSVWSKQAKLTASDGSAMDYLGYSLDISGDTVVAGAYNNENGAAYVFTGSGSSWSQQQKLTASDGAVSFPYDLFGYSVAIDGDNIVVGSKNDTIDGVNSGSAYYFKRVASTWTEEYKVLSSDNVSGDDFSSGVAIDGDIVVVGAESKSSTGGAYMFARVTN